MIDKEESKAITVFDSRFEFRGRITTYTLSFYTDCLKIHTKQAVVETIPYENITKMKQSKTSVKIHLKDGAIIQIPCTVENKRRIFVTMGIREPKLKLPQEIVAVVLVHFGDLSFLVALDSAIFDDFRHRIIRRVAMHFYPSCNLENISVEDYVDFAFMLSNTSKGAGLFTDEDLAAAIFFYDGKLEVQIMHKNGQAYRADEMGG